MKKIRFYFGLSALCTLGFGALPLSGCSKDTTPEVYKVPFKVTASQESSLTLKNFGGNNPNFQYSIDDGKNWTLLTSEITIPIGTSQSILLKGNNPNGFSVSGSKYSSISMTGSVKISGNIMGLLDDGKCESDRLTSTYCFYKLFENNTAITDFPELPATTLSDHCYQDMFKGCTNLKTGPSILPASLLTVSCYSNMFYGCTNLVNAPELPAKKMEQDSYSSMFTNCTSLVNAPELPATVLVPACYAYMFSGCTSLIKAPSILPSTTLTKSCYSYMFNACTNLKNAPKLPAVKLEESCYFHMFDNCKNLEVAPLLAATELANSCYSGMFYCCTNLRLPAEFKLQATQLQYGCYSYMFNSCEKLNLPSGFALPATSLAEYCYSNMFKGCSGLVLPPALPATNLCSNCYNEMFASCTSLSTPPIMTGVRLEGYRCCYSMFWGCKNLKVTTTITSNLFFNTTYIYTESAKDMFNYTGGDFKGTPSANVNYYFE